jgi:hypothetical protein
MLYSFILHEVDIGIYALEVSFQRTDNARTTALGSFKIGCLGILFDFALLYHEVCGDNSSTLRIENISRGRKATHMSR